MEREGAWLRRPSDAAERDVVDRLAEIGQSAARSRNGNQPGWGSSCGDQPRRGLVASEGNPDQSSLHRYSPTCHRRVDGRCLNTFSKAVIISFSLTTRVPGTMFRAKR